MNRRSLLTGAAAASGAALLAPLGRLLAADVPPARRRLLQVNGYAVDAETPLDALTDYLTPNDLFFVRHHWVPQLPDKSAWKLTVDGEVSSPLELTLADLKKLPEDERHVRPAVRGQRARPLQAATSPASSGSTAPSATRSGRASA